MIRDAFEELPDGLVDPTQVWCQHPIKLSVMATKPNGFFSFVLGSINSHYFHIIGDGKNQPNSRGLYTYYEDSLFSHKQIFSFGTLNKSKQSHVF